MKRLLILFSVIGMWLVFAGCGSKKNTSEEIQSQPEEPVFGVYKFGTKGNIQVQLNSDSTAVLDINKTQVQSNTGIGAVHNEGTFTFRNDSIFINWKSGSQIKSKFVRNGGTYSFRIGSTTYKRKL